MHARMMDSLEEYLAGVLEPVALRAIEARLGPGDLWREEIAGMRQVSELFATLKLEAPAPSAPMGFYARVMQEVGGRKPIPTFSSLFALDLAFGRRLAFACLLTLAVLGSYLVTRETG